MASRTFLEILLGDNEIARLLIQNCWIFVFVWAQTWSLTKQCLRTPSTPVNHQSLCWPPIGWCSSLLASYWCFESPESEVWILILTRSRDCSWLCLRQWRWLELAMVHNNITRGFCCAPSLMNEDPIITLYLAENDRYRRQCGKIYYC